MKICAVVVTYNRLEKLTKVLQSFDNQTVYPDKVYIVNNNSTDGTFELLKKWNDKDKNFDTEIINLEENIGGSGGFYAGLDKALNDGFDWIWLSDDDAYPDKDAFKFIYEEIQKYQNDSVAALCGMVLSNDGIDFSHRRNLNGSIFKVKEKLSTLEDYQKDYFTINALSYVGCILNSQALKKVGLTIKDYFILYDDTEHSLRLSEVGKIICIPKIKVFHDVKKSSNLELSWKSYYGQRNRLDMYKRHFPKRMYFYHLLRSSVKIVLKFLTGNVVEAKLLYSAVNDCQHNKSGIHPIYKPGWKPDK